MPIADANKPLQQLVSIMKVRSILRTQLRLTPSLVSQLVDLTIFAQGDLLDVLGPNIPENEAPLKIEELYFIYEQKSAFAEELLHPLFLLRVQEYNEASIGEDDNKIKGMFAALERVNNTLNFHINSFSFEDIREDFQIGFDVDETTSVYIDQLIGDHPDLLVLIASRTMRLEKLLKKISYIPSGGGAIA